MMLSFRALAVCGQYEPGLLKILGEHIKEGDTVVDVGANEGFITIPLARLVGDTGRVYAIEPDLNNIQTLCANIEANNLSNVSVIPKAMSDKRGIATFYGNRAWGSIVNSGGVASGTVETYLLDNTVNGPIHLIKIDTEGNDIRVIRGTQRLIQTYKPVIVFEVSLSALAYVDISIQETFDFLRGNGYGIFVEKNGALTPFKECGLNERVSTLVAI